MRVTAQGNPGQFITPLPFASSSTAAGSRAAGRNLLTRRKRSYAAGIGQVMKWAIGQGHRTDNPAGDAVGAALPKVEARPVHQRALPHAEVGAALAHVNGNRVEAAYQRTDLFDRRRILMTDWAAYVA